MEKYLIIQWYHRDGSKDGLPSPVGFETEGNLRAFCERLERFNVLYMIISRSEVADNDREQVDRRCTGI